MTLRKPNPCILCFAIAAIAGLAMVHYATAQQRPRRTIDRKTNQGKGFWENERASRSVRHARDYSRGLYRYSRDAQDLRPEVAKSESEELRRNIDKAQKELAAVGKQYAGDKEVQAALETINTHIAKAAEVHKQLHEECSKVAPDGDVTMHCCSQITKELDKAAAEHAALVRSLEQRAKAAAAKIGSK